MDAVNYCLNTFKDRFFDMGINSVKKGLAEKALEHTRNRPEDSFQIMLIEAHQQRSSKESYYVDKQSVEAGEFDVGLVGKCLEEARESFERSGSLIFDDECFFEACFVNRVLARERVVVSERYDEENPVDIELPITDFDEEYRAISGEVLTNLEQAYRRDLERDGVLSEFVHSKKFSRELLITSIAMTAMFTGGGLVCIVLHDKFFNKKVVKGGLAPLKKVPANCG